MVTLDRYTRIRIGPNPADPDDPFTGQEARIGHPAGDGYSVQLDNDLHHVWVAAARCEPLTESPAAHELVVIEPAEHGAGADLRTAAGLVIWANVNPFWAARLAAAWNDQLARLERLASNRPNVSVFQPEPQPANGVPTVSGDGDLPHEGDW